MGEGREGVNASLGLTGELEMLSPTLQNPKSQSPKDQRTRQDSNLQVV